MLDVVITGAKPLVLCLLLDSSAELNGVVRVASVLAPTPGHPKINNYHTFFTNLKFYK